LAVAAGYSICLHQQQRLTAVRTVVRQCSCRVCMSIVTSCVGGGCLSASLACMCLPTPILGEWHSLHQMHWHCHPRFQSVHDANVHHAEAVRFRCHPLHDLLVKKILVSQTLTTRRVGHNVICCITIIAIQWQSRLGLQGCY
jgi:hypothetical protein